MVRKSESVTVLEDPLESRLVVLGHLLSSSDVVVAV
jgi:hypothetical protein